MRSVAMRRVQRRVVLGAQEPISRLFERGLFGTARGEARTSANADWERLGGRRESTASSLVTATPAATRQRHAEVSVGLWTFLNSSCRRHASFNPTLFRSYATTSTKPKRLRKTSSSSSSPPQVPPKQILVPSEYRNPAPPPALSLISPTEQDEVFFDLVTSPPPPITEAERCAVHGADVLRAEVEGEWEAMALAQQGLSSSSTTKTKSTTTATTGKAYRSYTKRKVAVKLLPGPPDASREALWDWRNWFSSAQGGLCRGLGYRKNVVQQEEQAARVAAELEDAATSGKKKRTGKGDAVTVRQLTVKRRKADLSAMQLGEAFYDEVKEYKKQCVHAFTQCDKALTFATQLLPRDRRRTARGRRRVTRAPRDLGALEAQR